VAVERGAAVGRSGSLHFMHNSLACSSKARARWRCWLCSSIVGGVQIPALFVVTGLRIVWRGAGLLIHPEDRAGERPTRPSNMDA